MTDTTTWEKSLESGDFVALIMDHETGAITLRSSSTYTNLTVTEVLRIADGLRDVVLGAEQA